MDMGKDNKALFRLIESSLKGTEIKGSPTVNEDLDQVKTELLKKSELFRSFDRSSMSKIIESSKNIILKKDEVLFEEGNQGSSMYIILVGELVVFNKFKTIARLSPGQFLGEMSVLESKARSASVKAVNDVAFLLELNEQHFVEFLCTDPKALLGMLKVMSRRIRQDLDGMAKDMEKLNIFTHDMRNCLVPLQAGEIYLEDIGNAMCGTTQDHVKRKGWEKVKKSFDAMLSARNNVITLIDQSQAFVKKQKSQYLKETADLGELIRNTIQEVSYHNYLKNKSIDLEIEGHIGKVHFNSLDIKRVIQNLLINAGYATKTGGKITIFITNLGEKVKVSVVDRGFGILDDIKPLLLKESLTTRPEGNGFGLLSCRDIIQDYHQGEIWFESEVNKGTAFHFTLPL